MQNHAVKEKGRVYTPKYIVKNILDIVDYKKDILKKHIIDNSCGDGAFLVEIVRKYCQIYFSSYSDKVELRDQLTKYIHGIEIDSVETEKCINNLNIVTSHFGIFDVEWDVICADTLTISKYNGCMDYVVGNPPYVRVHNLAESYCEVKKYKFCENGMTDLYIVFFEIGLKMLNDTGKMSYIAPSSFLRSNAGKGLRQYITDSRRLTKIVDLGHYQPFAATAYTMITLFENNAMAEDIEYYTYCGENKIPKYIESVPYSDVFINGCMYISKREYLSTLHRIENHYKSADKMISVKNGFATLSDSIFIGNFDFEDCTIDIYKASTAKWYKCIFPYNKDATPMDIDTLKNHTQAYLYLNNNEDILKKRDIRNQEQWFLFGRSQALKDVFVNKIAVNTTIKDEASIKIANIPAGKGVYSGLYILTTYSFDEICKAIKSKDFIEYLKLLKNYKSGGYYSFSSSELMKFLSYKLEEAKNEQLQLLSN